MSATRSWSLRTRLLLASAALALVLGIAFLVLVHAVATLRAATEEETHAKDVMAATLALETSVLDMETGLRGLVITGSEVFLAPWGAALRALPSQLARFEQLTNDDPEQRRRAQRLADAIRAYVNDYSRPVVRSARENPEFAASPEATAEGRERLTEIRAQFASFVAMENRRAAASAEAATDRANLAIALGVATFAVLSFLIAAFTAYLARAIARPVRGVAAGASRLAGGDLSVRLDETGPGEIGELTRSFNVMAGALARSRAELELQNRRLRESEKLKTELIAIVSHELRTPLASMLGFASLLLQRDTDEETRHRYLEIIHSQGQRLSSLLDDFLNVQRIEEGRLELANEPVDMAALLQEQAQLYSAESDRHRLELRLAEQRLPVRGDANRLAQVVGNLLSNAIKYSPSGGRVEIVGERANGTVSISVRDEGVGIPEHQRDKIFTKFFRGDAAASGIAGSGLGLAFARAVVEAHGGRISFTSEAGKGSIFRIELPTPAREPAGSGAAGEKGER